MSLSAAMHAAAEMPHYHASLPADDKMPYRSYLANEVCAEGPSLLFFRCKTVNHFAALI